MVNRNGRQRQIGRSGQKVREALEIARATPCPSEVCLRASQEGSGPERIWRQQLPHLVRRVDAAYEVRPQPVGAGSPQFPRCAKGRTASGSRRWSGSRANNQDLLACVNLTKQNQPAH